MKPNIFQKVAFLVYISIILFICIYFVPYQNNTNYTFHSSIMSDGYGTMSYFRFLIYLIVPTISFYFVRKYLEGMNSLESCAYKKKAKRELYVFFFFASIIAGVVLFSYGKNEYSEFRKKKLESQISEINNSFTILKEELNKRPPFVYEILDNDSKKPWEKNYEVLEEDSEIRDNSFVPPSDGIVLKGKRPPLDLSGARDILEGNVDEYGIKIKKTTTKLNLDLSEYYKDLQKVVDNVLKEVSNFKFSAIRKTQLEKNIKELIYKESSSEDLNNMIIDYVELFSTDGLKKTKLEFELKELNFYSIKFNVVFVFLGSFILLYIIRPLFSMFQVMLKEVR